jgi:hypothetical protein
MRIKKMRLGAMLAALVSYGCSQATIKCANFPFGYKRMNIVTSTFKEVRLDLPEIKRSLLTIQECYPSHRYMEFNNKLEIKYALRFRDNAYLVVAELDGVSDLILMFEIDREGEIIGSYQGSMQ